MTIKTYFLSEDKTVYLKAYMLDNVEGLPFCEKRPGILILPGGGYEYCSAREGEPVAMHYLAEGYNAFVLIYSCNTRHPAPLLNASYAILKLRQRCEEFGIDPNKLAGYTAGVYASRNWYNNNLQTARLENYHIWLAEYRSVPLYQGYYKTWQYTSKGKVDGIEGRVDMNITYE